MVYDAQADLNTCVTLRKSADELSKNLLSVELHYYDVLKHLAKHGPSTLVIPDSVIGMKKGLKEGENTQ